MPKAFVIGGSGQIGFAIGNRLSHEGWSVILSSRSSLKFDGPWQHVKLDINQPDIIQLDVNQLFSRSEALSDEFDLLISCIAFDASDARELLKLQPRAKRIVAISSASVYQDTQGRTLDEAKDCGFPVFDGPLTEETTTVPAGPETYSTRKIAMENELLANADIPVTILRPCVIHGPYSKHSREWWFVKRILDGRKQIPLAYGGRSQFQTTSASAIAEVILRSSNEDLPAVINVADLDSPTVKEIGQTIITAMNSNAELVGLADAPYPATEGATPWSIPQPFICDSSARSINSYAETVPDTINWLVDKVHGKSWQELLPQLASYPQELFDYLNDDKAVLRKK